MFELYRKYHFTVAQNVISSTGRAEIDAFIALQDVCGGQWQTLNPHLSQCLLPVLPSDWKWQWLVTEKGDFKGTFPTRVKQFYFKRYGIKCPDTFLAQIGNLARKHSESNEQYIFDFTDRIDWEDGDFGDGGSCYWGDNEGARVMLEDNGAMAIRFYDADGYGKGRAWLVAIDTDLYIIFNGYGIGGGATLQISRIFAAFVNLDYKFISVTNRAGHTLYINHGGYVIGKTEVISAISHHDFGWDDVHIDTCYNCGDALMEGEGYYAPDDNTYCEYCYDRLFSSCERCYETFHNEDLHFVESAHESVCSYCRVEYFDVCQGCSEWFEQEDLHEHAEDLYCWQCLNETTSPPDWAE